MKKVFTLIILFSVTAWAQLSGTYSIGTNTISGEAGNYSSLSAATTALNTSGINGPCIFYFTDNATYTDTAIYLGVTGTSATNTITFKPYTGVTATISLTRTANTGQTGSIDGAWSIGSPTGVNTNLVSTNYVTIDGSNTESGTTKDLTIQGASTGSQLSVLRIFGNNDNITIKNCIITNNSTSGSTTAPINVTNYNSASVNYTPDNITIQNNTLNSTTGNGAAGIHISNSGTPTAGLTGLVVRDNTISARVRGMFVSYTIEGNIYGNTFSVASQASQGAVGITFQTTFSSGAGTFNVYNNKFTTLTTMNTTAGASNGIIGIDMQSTTPRVFNVYNNMISGLGPATAATTNSKIYGIRATSSGTYNIYHNTIYIPEMTDMTVFGTSYIAGIVYASTSESSPTTGGTMNAKNNIIVTDETGSSMKVYAVRRGGTNGTFNCDYNNYYINASHTNGYIGLDNATDQQTFANWVANTLYDDNSKNVSVTFVSTTDLHVSGASNGDVNLIGVTGLGISTDIDGASRSGTYPYMGADEGTIALPVELTSFTASTKGTSVELRWSTATEVDNHGFEIQRSEVRGQTSADSWAKVGFVEGAGNSSAPKSYSFTDANVQGRVVYRLKQIDRDGKFSYSSEVELTIVSQVPEQYTLMQNFPNPFNPVTTIRFSVKSIEHATLKVFDIAGREVATLFNDVAQPGELYNVPFNASAYPSGIYFYTLRAGNSVETKKMLLVK